MARIECKFDADARLITGAAVIAAHVAHRGGLASAAAAEIGAAAKDACEALAVIAQQDGAPRPQIRLAASESADRIEVTIGLVPGTPNPASAQETTDSAEKIRQMLKGAAVDGVNVAVKNGYPQITLIKSHSAATRRFVV
jgi:hypothetical protein